MKVVTLYDGKSKKHDAYLVTAEELKMIEKLLKNKKLIKKLLKNDK